MRGKSPKLAQINRSTGSRFASDRSHLVAAQTNPADAEKGQLGPDAEEIGGIDGSTTRAAAASEFIPNARRPNQAATHIATIITRRESTGGFASTINAYTTAIAATAASAQRRGIGRQRSAQEHGAGEDAKVQPGDDQQGGSRRSRQRPRRDRGRVARGRPAAPPRPRANSCGRRTWRGFRCPPCGPVPAIVRGSKTTRAPSRATDSLNFAAKLAEHPLAAKVFGLVDVARIAPATGRSVGQRPEAGRRPRHRARGPRPAGSRGQTPAAIARASRTASNSTSRRTRLPCPAKAIGSGGGGGISRGDFTARTSTQIGCAVSAGEVAEVVGGKEFPATMAPGGGGCGRGQQDHRRRQAKPSPPPQQPPCRAGSGRGKPPHDKRQRPVAVGDNSRAHGRQDNDQRLVAGLARFGDNGTPCPALWPEAGEATSVAARPELGRAKECGMVGLSAGQPSP